MAQKREAVIQVRNLYKIYRIGENRVRALNGVCLLYTSDAADE